MNMETLNLEVKVSARKIIHIARDEPGPLCEHRVMEEIIGCMSRVLDKERAM